MVHWESIASQKIIVCTQNNVKESNRKINLYSNKKSGSCGGFQK
jgi:hypothetical protein